MLTMAFLGLPAAVWLSLFIATGLGLVLLVTGRYLAKDTLRRDLARDIGIAFLVAAIVSCIYEYSTRSVEEHETILTSINRAMSAFIPDDVWNEVKEQILRRSAIRHNVEIEMRLRHVTRLPNGKEITLPPGKAVIWVSYGYDLQGLSADDTRISIQHELDYFMHDAALALPRFDRVLVVRPGAEIERVYEGASLRRIYDGKGSIKLEGNDALTLPPRESGQRVRIITERYELVNVPGYYYLVMRELTAREATSPDPAIKLTISELPSDVDAKVETFYAPHRFTAGNEGKTVWFLDKTLLPGQGLTVVFTPHTGLPKRSD